MAPSRHIAFLTAAALFLGLVPSALPTSVDAAGNIASAAAARRDVTGKDSASRDIVRLATFNVRTSRATQDKQQWLQRAPEVAREILERAPGIVTLQELGPGRADGQRGTLNGNQRQTDSLTSALTSQGGWRYRLVRTTSYVEPGTRHGTQGARILYDSTRFELLSDCPDNTGNRSFSSSCSIELPIAEGDNPRLRRSAAYAAFRDRRTGRSFFVVSAHLDSRHSRSDRTEAKFTWVRARQAAAIANTLSTVNSSGWPVVFGGDINSWQTDRGGYAPHRIMANQGFLDATTATLRYNFAYPTINHFKTRLRKSKNRAGGVRLDVLMVRGGHEMMRYENKLEPVDPDRPSDHNMVLADVVL